MKTEEKYMKLALAEAHKARVKDEVPVGAVIIKEGKVVARGHNLIRSKKDASAHAEMVALKKASQKLKNERLTGCELYVTLEPCAMCAGAMVLARIDKLCFGASEPKTGACGSVYDIPGSGRNNHRIEVKGGVMSKECGELLSNFFKEKRKAKK